MNWKKLLLPVFIFSVGYSYGQSNFTFSPGKPKAGEVITINYNPSGNITSSGSALKAIVYKMGSKGQSADDLALNKSGSNYTATVKTDTSDNFVYFSFEADQRFDGNNNNGYWIQLYNGDQLKKGSNLSLSLFYQYYGQNAGLDRDDKKALQAMEDEFRMYPEEKRENLISFTPLYLKIHPDDPLAFIQKEIEDLIKSGLKGEEDYVTLRNLYSLAKLPQQAELISGLEKEKFPGGKWQIGETIRDFIREGDLSKKKTRLDNITFNIEHDSNWAYLKSSLSNYRTILANAYQTKKDWNGMNEVIRKYDIKGMALANLYNNSAWEIQESDKNLEIAEKMAAEAVRISNKERKSPSESKPSYLTLSQWAESLDNSYGMYADTYAMVNYKLGKYKIGFPYSKEAALAIGKGKIADENNTYSLLAEKVLPAKKYVKQLEQFVKDGKSTSGIKEILKRAYVKKHKSDEGYDKYIATLEKASYLKMVEDLKKGILDETSPSFVLSDMKGNKVNIQDLKGKVVIVDFWATWCGPCKASFPAMQKMVTKYKDDPDVKFVFVDTWETADKKVKNAADFIADHKYDFHVLMDNDNKVVGQFKVTGIPTKFVIDKKGTIRFKSVGFDGSDDKLVAELSAMINLVKAM